MSTITEVIKTSNQLNTTYSTAKVALGDNEFISGSFTAAASEDIAEGTLFGRISATGYFKKLDKDSTDGSQYPVGVFYNGIGGSKTVVSGTTYTIILINKGKVNSSMLVFATGESLTSVVSDRQFKDHLAAIGIVLEDSVQLAALDN
jgi:hypothetical protein